MSSATRTRAGSTALLALIIFCSPPLAAQTAGISPEEAERRAFASRDPDESHRWLKIAAEAGLRDAQWLLGEDYVRGSTSAGKDVDLGIEWLRKAALQGSAHAQSMMGWVHVKGIGVKPDFAEAVKWFTAAARQEDAYALLMLSEAYYHGTGVTQDRTRSKRLMLRAAELGNQAALRATWRTLLLGNPEDRDVRLGMHFLTKGANAHDATSAYTLGREYLTGRDVPRDNTRAVLWLERAAKDKHALASLWLSELHAKGLGVPQDRARAEKMLQAALRSAEIRDKNLFSWALAVTPDEQLRNSALAIRVLEPALATEKERQPAYLDTLAAAYAEHGQFDKAVATQVEAIETQQRTRPGRMTKDMEERLALYRAGKTYREEML